MGWIFTKSSPENKIIIKPDRTGGERILMRYSEAKQGRVFVIRLEDGEIVHEEVERFAKEQSISRATLIILGGAGEGSRLVVGPEISRARPITPMQHILDDVHEITGTGTLFPDKKGNPVLHLHMACGRNDSAITGCIRSGVMVWQVMEIVLIELIDNTASRIFNDELGFNILHP